MKKQETSELITPERFIEAIQKAPSYGFNTSGWISFLIKAAVDNKPELAQAYFQNLNERLLDSSTSAPRLRPLTDQREVDELRGLANSFSFYGYHNYQPENLKRLLQDRCNLLRCPDILLQLTKL